MTIEYKVSPDGLRVETYPKGVLNIETTVDYFNKLQNDKSIGRDAVEIVYFKHVTDFDISFTESRTITESYQDAKKAQLIRATIFVCDSESAYGIGRMLQTFHEITNPRHKVVLVRSESEIESTVNKL